MRPRIYGSSDSQIVRSNTCPLPGAGTGYSSMRKSDAFGSPTGRDARTIRLPWAMMSLLHDDFVDAIVARKIAVRKAVEETTCRPRNGACAKPLSRRSVRRLAQQRDRMERLREELD